jgi:hypothetical protein
MKIVDNILFCNEYDILELRLRIMYDYVDEFVIVESDRTFTHNYKGYNLEKHFDRYSQWADKIRYLKVTGSPNNNAWAAEDWQRDQFATAWTDLTNDDVVIISDCDEIIRPDALEFIRSTDYNYYGLYMPAFYFKFNYLDTKQDWHYKVWARAYRGFKSTPHGMRYIGPHEVPGKTVKLHHAGWHFGWIGDEEFARNKIQSFSHQEINRPDVLDNIDIEKHISEGRDHFRPENVTWVKVDLDDYFPKELTNNKDKYLQYVLSNTGKTVRDFWPKQILEIE